MNIDKEKILIYYDEGQLYQEFYVIDRKLNGIRTWYYKSGKIKQTGNYINSNCDGDFISYYQSGEIKSITHYQNGKILGIKNFDIKMIDKTKVGIQNSNQKIINTSKQISTKACNEASRIKKEKLNYENLKDILNIIINFIIKNKKLVKIAAIIMIIIFCNFHFNVYDRIKDFKNTVVMSFKNEKDSKKESFYNKLIKFKDEKVAYVKEKIKGDEDSSQKNNEIKKESFYNKLIKFKDEKITYIKKKIGLEEKSSQKINEPKDVTPKDTEKINNKITNEILKEEIKIKPQITTQMKKDNFIKLLQILKNPKYKTYILNIGAGYKISLPDGAFTSITQNAKNKNLKFSSKYNEMSINLKIVSLQNMTFKSLYEKEINISNGKMTILNADLSRNKYYINGKKNKIGIYKYAYYNKDKKEVVLIDFYYPISIDKDMKKMIKTTLDKFKKK